jgi:5-formyltetrahydrofolate cyclo-ligase
MEPAGGTAVVPDALIVPLLGFDAACQRIGYGAGHYDCTIAALRAAGRNPACIGIAFAAQYSDTPIPAGPHDIALDCVVTEERLYWPQTADDGDDDGKD